MEQVFNEPQDIPADVTKIRDRDGSRYHRDDDPNIWRSDWADNEPFDLEELAAWGPFTRVV